MNQVSTHYKGILLWVDDNFIENPLQKDVDQWVKLFGDQSDHVYRLMDLQLRIAMTYDEGKKMMQELAEFKKQGAYIFCILDLKLPKDKDNREFVSSQYGIKLAKLAQEKGFNAVFLTTATESTRDELIERGLASIHYYQKLEEEQIIPDTLVRYILSNFRSHISWISLRDIYDGLKKDANQFSRGFREKIDCLSAKYFPYLDSFRDFVERWEYRPPLKRGAVVVFRCPPSHGDPFIQQCLMVTLNNLVQKYPNHIAFKYAGPSGPQHIAESPADSEGITVNAIRIVPPKTTSKEFFKLLKEVPRPGNITFFILPNDETSDEYLEQALKFSQVTYEDLPTIRLGDSPVREAIIRSTLNLVLQHVRILTDSREKKPLGDIYLDCPEILIKPLIWVILLESSKVAEELSDPFEFIDQIEQQSFKIQGDHVDPRTRMQLINGEPIPVSLLFEFGVDILKNDREIDFNKYLQEKWLPLALKLWLTKSWQFPYGVDKKLIQAQNAKNRGNKNLEEKWEEFSLTVLMDLVSSYHLEGGVSGLDFVYGFLTHEAINGLLEGRVDDIPEEIWTDLLGEKWPYHKYPLPVALNKKLINAGRNLWVETDNFNLTRIFPSTRLRHKHLDDVVNKIGQQLKWVEFQCDNLPGEWAFYIGKFVRWLLNDSIEDEWQKNRRQMYYYLLDLYKNILPLSFMAHTILDGRWNTEAGVEDIFEKIKGMKRPGEILGIINGIRKKNMFGFIRPSKHWFFSSRNQAFELSNQFTLLKSEYYGHVQMDNFVNKLKSGNLLYHIYVKLSPEEKKKLLRILGVEELTAKICKNALSNKKMSPAKKRALFNLLKNRAELEDLIKTREDNDPGEIVKQFFTGIMNHGHLDCKKEEACILENILDEIAKINAQLSENFQRTEGCDGFCQKELLGTLFSTPFDVFGLSLNAFEKISMALLRLNYVDGFHFLNSVRWLRNQWKEIAPADNKNKTIEYIFELFCFGIESLIAQLKFLLEISGETELADKISLKYVKKIEVPGSVKIPPKDILNRFYQVGRKDGTGAYNVYHLGIPGTAAENQKVIILNQKAHTINEEKRN